MPEDGDDSTRDCDGDAESLGLLARVKTAIAEAVGVVVDAVLDAI